MQHQAPDRGYVEEDQIGFWIELASPCSQQCASACWLSCKGSMSPGQHPSNQWETGTAYSKLIEYGWGLVNLLVNNALKQILQPEAGKLRFTKVAAPVLQH